MSDIGVSDIGLRDKLYWRPHPGSVWHCFKRVSGNRRLWISLCPKQHEMKRSYGQSIDRPPSELRCAGCDGAEMKRRGWTEGGIETLTHNQIYDLYKYCRAMGAKETSAMTADEMNKAVLTTYIGRIMRRKQTTFKIVCCLGPARGGIKLRVAVWSENQRTWSNPQTVTLDKLEEITLAEITPRQRQVCQHAATNIENYGGGGFGTVKHGRGIITPVGRPWFTKGAPSKSPAPGVTKLAGAKLSATADRTKLQKLNHVLSDWAFGKRSK